jgi:hypothetical protein
MPRYEPSLVLGFYARGLGIVMQGMSFSLGQETVRARVAETGARRRRAVSTGEVPNSISRKRAARRYLCASGDSTVISMMLISWSGAERRPSDRWLGRKRLRNCATHLEIAARVTRLRRSAASLTDSTLCAIKRIEWLSVNWFASIHQDSIRLIGPSGVTIKRPTL